MAGKDDRVQHGKRVHGKNARGEARAMGQTAERILKRLDGVFEEEEWHVPLRAAVSGLIGE